MDMKTFTKNARSLVGGSASTALERFEELLRLDARLTPKPYEEWSGDHSGMLKSKIKVKDFPDGWDRYTGLCIPGRATGDKMPAVFRLYVESHQKVYTYDLIVHG